MRILPYRKDLQIENLEQLPHGTGAKYLQCYVVDEAKGEHVIEHLIAMQWRRKQPRGISPNHVLIAF